MNDKTETVGDVEKRIIAHGLSRIDHNIQCCENDLADTKNQVAGWERKLKLLKEERECFILRAKCPIISGWNPDSIKAVLSEVLDNA